MAKLRRIFVISLLIASSDVFQSGSAPFVGAFDEASFPSSATLSAQHASLQAKLASEIKTAAAEQAYAEQKAGKLEAKRGGPPSAFKENAANAATTYNTKQDEYSEAQAFYNICEGERAALTDETAKAWCKEVLEFFLVVDHIFPNF